MRTDQNLGRKSFRYSPGWKEDQANQNAQSNIDNRLEGYEIRPDGKVVVHSLSGNEPNHLFINHQGKEFEDTSAISGLDNPADSRGWALLDYDRDGWQDVALVNANTPLLNLYHNNIGSLTKLNNGGIIALRFIGGGGGHSPRDGYGTIVEMSLPDGSSLKREHRCGEGYSSQNSATMIIGIGQNSNAQSIDVRWPSGKKTTLKNISEGTLVTAFETRPGQSFTQEPYRSKTPTPARPKKTYSKFPFVQESNSAIHLYTTTATWCSACLGQMPALTELKQNGISLFGIPIDPNDNEELLTRYIKDENPPYKMLVDLAIDDREQIANILVKELRTERPPLPSTIITDSKGNILKTMTGIPTLSQIRKLALKPNSISTEDHPF